MTWLCLLQTHRVCLTFAGMVIRIQKTCGGAYRALWATIHYWLHGCQLTGENRGPLKFPSVLLKFPSCNLGDSWDTTSPHQAALTINRAGNHNKATCLHNMSQQYHFSPQPEAPTPPLLDPQNNPTPLLKSFADGVFNYLDHACEPKGSRLLEQNKIAAMQSFILPHEHHVRMQEFRPVLYNSYFMAFSVETSFGDNGPAVTRLGFRTYLRAMIMSDPDEAFKDFLTLNQAMQLGHQFDRSQFLRVADPKAKNIDNRLKAYISKVLTDISMKVYQDGFCDICFNTLTHPYQSCLDCDDYAVCEGCFALAPKRHTVGHRFESTGSTSASQGKESGR